MHLSSKPKTSRRVAGMLRSVSIAVCCAAVLSGGVFAQSKQPTRTKRAVSPDARAQRRAKQRPARKKPGALEMNPNAKWSCANTTITLEPVWRGAKELTFPFKIRNVGTEDLRIKARGG